MACQFISAFIIIGLIVFLGVVMTLGVMKSKVNQARLAGQLDDHQSPSGD